MAAQTLTTGTPSERINFDSTTLAGLNNGETIAINGGHLLIDGDTRWGNNNAVVDSMSISATLGGSIRIDATQTWEVPFSSSTGNVPTRAVAGSNAITGAGITGELQAVWATGSLTPSSVGGAMPASGWIKLRSKTGDFSNGLVITLHNGATITCSGAGKRSWIHIAAEISGTVTVPRLGEFVTRGDWYDLGTTNGADDQTFQFPVADACPAIEIETSPGSGEYEWYLNAGGRWGTATPFVPTDVRGKYFGMDNATGVITIARRSSNECGFKPLSGCKVRIPNIILSTSTSADFTVNSINSTLNTRHDFTTTAAGVVDIENVSGNWFFSFTNCFRLTVKNSTTLHSFNCANIADALIVDNLAVGLTGTGQYSPVNIASCLTSVSLNRVRAVRYAIASTNQFCAYISDSANITITDCRFELFGSDTSSNRGSAAAHSFNIVRCFSVTIDGLIAIGGRISITTVSDIKMTDTQFADILYGEQNQSFALLSALAVDAGTVRALFDGFRLLDDVPNVHPYLNLIDVRTGCKGVEFRNFGTPTNPINMGTVPANACRRIATVTNSLDIALRRLYSINNREDTFSISNTTQNVIIDNVWGMPNLGQAIAGVNLLARGCRWMHSTSGQSSCYGRHWEDAWTSETTGNILIAANEPLAATASQVETTVGPAFTSTGRVTLPFTDSAVTWTMPYYALGVTGFQGALATQAAVIIYGTAHSNLKQEYQIDKGTGFSGWKRLATHTIRASGGTAGTSSFVINVRNPDDMPLVGDFASSVVNNRLPAGTTVVSVVGNTVTLSNSFITNLASSEGVVFWRELAEESGINPAVGVKLKVRVSAWLGATNNDLIYLSIGTTTDAVNQRLQYPLPRTELTVTGFEPGSDVVIYDATITPDGSGSNVLATGDAVSGYFVFDYEGTPQIKIGVFKGGFVPQVTPQINLTTSNSSYTVQQRIDRNYQ